METTDEPETEVEPEQEEVEVEQEVEETPEETMEDTDPTEPVEEEGDTEEDTQETLEADADEVEENTQDSNDLSDFDYKASFEALMAPIKANGQEVQIKTPEDARKLIQKGLNYDDKMVAIKPVRLAGKALERAGIIRDGVIDEEALNRMIDFNNGNIEVMKERLKELNIDPLELDLESTNYQAENHMVDEHSIVLDDIQRELDTRGSTEQVVGALSNMDEGSKAYFAENPHQLLGLEQDITNGVFDEIYSNVQYERRMGRLNGKTDIEAYIEFARARGQQLQQQQPQAKAQQPAPKATKKVNTKKRAKAGGTKPSNSRPTDAVNPLDLSDEEFEKMFGSAQAVR
jgi:hypothetical protein